MGCVHYPSRSREALKLQGRSYRSGKSVMNTKPIVKSTAALIVIAIVLDCLVWRNRILLQLTRRKHDYGSRSKLCIIPNLCRRISEPISMVGPTSFLLPILLRDSEQSIREVTVAQHYAAHKREGMLLRQCCSKQGTVILRSQVATYIRIVFRPRKIVS